MTSKGQITIPSEVREALKLEPGTRFYVSARNGQVVAIPKNIRLADLAGFLGRPPSGISLSIEQMDEAIVQAVAEDDERITREWSESER
jgi:AbrB family looped-hinge helix DNA binding protein